VDERLPQYLHKPVQILWFGSDEFVLVITVIFVAVVVGGCSVGRSSRVFSFSFPGCAPSRAGSSRTWPGAGASSPSATIRVRRRPARVRPRDVSAILPQDRRSPGRQASELRYPSLPAGSSNLFEENRLLKVAVAGLFGITAVLGTDLHVQPEHTHGGRALRRGR
jgi:hypothetical protein